MLGDYEGTVILISHDRDFLDRVVTSVIAPEGDGRWIEYAGGYTDMLAQRGADLKREAVKAGADEKKEARGRGAPSTAAEAQAELQGQARAGNAAEDHRQAAGRDRQAAAASLTIPIFTRRIARSSTLPPAALSTAQKELEAAEDKWLELEVLREEIEQA